MRNNNKTKSNVEYQWPILDGRLLLFHCHRMFSVLGALGALWLTSKSYLFLLLKQLFHSISCGGVVADCFCIFIHWNNIKVITSQGQANRTIWKCRRVLFACCCLLAHCILWRIYSILRITSNVSECGFFSLEILLFFSLSLSSIWIVVHIWNAAYDLWVYSPFFLLLESGGPICVAIFPSEKKSRSLNIWRYTKCVHVCVCVCAPFIRIFWFNILDGHTNTITTNIVRIHMSTQLKQ